MRRLVPLCLVLGLHFACAAPTVMPERPLAVPATRANKDLVAKQALLDLEFFADGRGLMMVPELIDVYDQFNKSDSGRKTINGILRDRWGFVINKDRPSGLFTKPYEGFNLGVLGCATCHSSKAAGYFIPGLGNKNIDTLKIGEEVWFIQKLFSDLKLKKNQSPKYKEAHAFALNFANTINDAKLGNLTQGLVPVSIIQTWFYKQAGLPNPSTMNRGATKVPALWGYGTKRLTGKFSDGFGDGAAWLVSIELTAGQKPETVRGYFPKVEAAEASFADLLPPEYPFEKDCKADMPGKKIFDGEGRCWQCHGTNERDAEGYPIYKQPKFIPIEQVGTDADRTNAITSDFKKHVDANPLRDVMWRNQRDYGYIAPRLEGIWARFPYLHNASVPSLRALLTNPNDRPPFFSLDDAGESSRFDRNSVGLTIPANGSVEYLKQKLQAESGARNVYHTAREGQSNQGHAFGTSLSDAQKNELIEYLKCL